MKAYSPTKFVPDPTVLLFIVTAALAWVFLAPGFTEARAWVLGALLVSAAGTAIYFLSSGIGVALWALLIAAVMSRFYLDIGGLKARPEHILMGLICVAALFHWKRRTEPMRWITADYFLMAYVGANFFCSLVMSIAPGQTLKWAVQQTLVIMAYFLLRLFADEPTRLRGAVRVLIAVGALEGAYAVICFYSNILFNTTFGVEVGQYGTFPGTYGTLFEANILGAFSASCLLMALVIYFQERQRRYLLATALTFAGMMIALSRAAIIAAAVSLVVLLFVGVRKGFVGRSGVKAVGTALLITTLVLASAIIPLYVQRFSTVEVSDISADPDTALRVVTIGMAVDDIVQHPILGNGTSSFQLLVSNKELGFTDLDETGTWIGNVEMRVIHDTGIVGLVIFVYFLVYLAVPAWKLLRKQHHPELLGLMLGALVYSMTFQATEGTLLAFSWVHLGLIGCAVAIYYPQGKGLREPLDSVSQ
ncbi:MAG TPA: O-antigen ligase family protein [Candidatus Angelobacter sp.]|nr:O-antigen ligase family protein [Candidatus Angelobacter sp.]